MRPDLEASGRDADPCQGQLLGPSVLGKSTNEERLVETKSGTKN